MATYIDRADLTPQQRKGLKYFAQNPDIGTEPFANGEAYALAVLAALGEKGYAYREANKAALTKTTFDAAPPPTTKAAILDTVAALFPDTE